jgi:hypothetical protein
MDNRIANDMISSGMIPSGEKKKEDLSRTQYGSAPSPNKLMDAYKSMYEHHQKDKDGNTIPHEGEELNEALPLVPMLGKVAAIAAKKGVAGLAAKGAGKAGLKATAMAFKNPTAGNIGKVAGQALKGAAKDQLIQRDVVGGAVNQMNQPKEKVNKSGMVTAGADLFDIVKGKLLDEGLSEEEIKDIMLTLTPDEILNEISAETALAASKARDVQAGKLKGPENTEKRKELRDKASQNYDRAVQKRQSGFVKNTASPQGPSRIPTSGM